MNVYLQRTNTNDFNFWRLIWDIILKKSPEYFAIQPIMWAELLVDYRHTAIM